MDLASVSGIDHRDLNNLPKTIFWGTVEMYQWEGFWFIPLHIEPARTFRSSFQANDDDVLLASSMKTGTTWLKSICSCILESQNTDVNNETEDILAKDNPHFIVRSIESDTLVLKAGDNLYNMPSPRLIHTHLPYTLLPETIKKSGCKIVYIARNPKDTLVSMWHFHNSILTPNQDPFPIEKAVESFCNGIHLFGPYFDHVLEYWKQSRERPNKILFMKYESLKSDPKGQVQKLASFLGRPFANDEEVEKVVRRCSFERLKNLEVNKNGAITSIVPNSSFFRKGVVGDWKNYLTPELEEQIDQMSSKKFEGSGLTL